MKITDVRHALAAECAKLKIALTLMSHARDAACEIIDEATGDDDWRKAHIAGLRKIGTP